MNETTVRVESVRVPNYRKTPGPCHDLVASIQAEGLRHPICLWKDGTLISGERRLWAHVLMKADRIPAVFVNTIEDAVKRLHEDMDSYLAVPMAWSEICALWARLRLLDAPADLKRRDEARRRGNRLRKQTIEGKRPPGRSVRRSEDYVLHVMTAPFDFSYQTGRRVETIWKAAQADEDTEQRTLARRLMAQLDDDAAVWPIYKQFKGIEDSPNQTAPPPPPLPRVPAAAAKQLAAWDRVLPALGGLVTGLADLGPPNPSLTWEQYGPVRAKLAAHRRVLEQIIKQMKPKENDKP